MLPISLFFGIYIVKFNYFLAFFLRCKLSGQQRHCKNKKQERRFIRECVQLFHVAR